MERNNVKADFLNKMIQEKLNNDEWNSEVVQRVLSAQKDKRKKWMQYTALPVIFLGTVTVFNYSFVQQKHSPDIAEQNLNLQKDKSQDEHYPDFKLHIIDAAFNQIK
ncbi:MAG: hypothetical protein OEV66_12410 [Spirochaetia bacterium]|nr:hypothetical protein [Spirochaetia bacterium]